MARPTALIQSSFSRSLSAMKYCVALDVDTSGIRAMVLAREVAGLVTQVRPLPPLPAARYRPTLPSTAVSR
jgi:hypothetical protein